jgi:hypothetical protein
MSRSWYVPQGLEKYVVMMEWKNQATSFWIFDNEQHRQFFSRETMKYCTMKSAMSWSTA